jgi:pyruvate/2-oxoacid:ferredoxin oxidoreductase alpha subunit
MGYTLVFMIRQRLCLVLCRTSHEINKISLLTPEAMEPLVDLVSPDIQAHRARALNPAHPRTQGTIIGADVYFQVSREALARGCMQLEVQL